MIADFLESVVEVAAGIALFEGVKAVSTAERRAELKDKYTEARLRLDTFLAERAARKAAAA